MFKEVILVALLAAAASGFSASGADDLATAQRLQDNHPSNGEIVASNDESPGSSTVDLRDNPAELASTSKRTRRCVQLPGCRRRDPYDSDTRITRLTPYDSMRIYDDRSRIGSIFDGGLGRPYCCY